MWPIVSRSVPVSKTAFLSADILSDRLARGRPCGMRSCLAVSSRIEFSPVFSFATLHCQVGWRSPPPSTASVTAHEPAWVLIELWSWSSASVPPQLCST